VTPPTTFGEVFPDLQAGGLEQRQDLFASGSGIRGRLEGDEVAVAEALAHLAHGAQDDREIGLAVGRERSRKGDHDRVRVAHDVVVGRRRERARVDERSERFGRHVLDVALPAADRCNALLVDIDEHDSDARFSEAAGEGQADVAGAHDGDVGRHSRSIVQMRSAIESAA
jgi:hypothetical protein